MQYQSRLFSTQKIIFLLVFTCAAIMASLFVFHLKHKPSANIPENYGLIFPAPRDIKNFNLVSSNNKTFTQKELQKHWTLLFFGFTHCAAICPNNLNILKKVYVDLKPRYQNLQVILVSLDPERDTLTTLNQYTRSFHPDFLSATGKLSELRKLQSQLGIYAMRDDGTDENYQLNHTASILLFNPQGKWTALFNYGLPPEKLKFALEKAIHS